MSVQQRARTCEVGWSERHLFRQTVSGSEVLSLVRVMDGSQNTGSR